MYLLNIHAKKSLGHKSWKKRTETKTKTKTKTKIRKQKQKENKIEYNLSNAIPQNLFQLHPAKPRNSENPNMRKIRDVSLIFISVISMT